MSSSSAPAPAFEDPSPTTVELSEPDEHVHAQPARGWARLIRAFLAGGAATIVDLAVLATFVSLFNIGPRIASLPALALGGVVSFFANRHWVFDASRGSLPMQAALYVTVELVALGLNGVLFDLAMRAPFIHAHASWYLPARLVTSHIVFLVWSYPLWRFVFRRTRVAVESSAKIEK